MYDQQSWWRALIPIIHYNELRRESSTTHLQTEASKNIVYDCSTEEIRLTLYKSIQIRGFDSVCLSGANDADIIDFASKVPPIELKKFSFGSLRCASVSDKGLEIFLAALAPSIIKLELTGMFKDFYSYDLNL